MGDLIQYSAWAFSKFLALWGGRGEGIGFKSESIEAIVMKLEI